MTTKRFGRLCLAAACVCAAGVVATSFAERAKHRNPMSFDYLPDGEWGGWSGVMTGRIIDEDGKPIPYAKIEVIWKDIKTTSDQNGFFSVRGLQKGGHYSLRVAAKGYEQAVLRWIPIPTYQTADIGDYHLDPEQVSTNYWLVSSNSAPGGSSSVASNFIEIIEGVTSSYPYAQWAEAQYLEEGRQEFARFATNAPTIDERPDLAGAYSNVPPPKAGN